MKSITLHNIDDLLFNEIKKKSVKSGSSLNKTIKQILTDSLGTNKKVANHSEFKEFLGVWSKADYKEFVKRTGDFDKINQDDWK